MKLARIVVTCIAIGVSPAFADETISLAKMTCKQFVEAPKDTVGVILTWMMGYLQDENEPAEINFTKMEDLAKKLGTHCGANPNDGLMKAFDKVTE